MQVEPYFRTDFRTRLPHGRAGEETGGCCSVGDRPVRVLLVVFVLFRLCCLVYCFLYFLLVFLCYRRSGGGYLLLGWLYLQCVKCL